MEESKWSTYFVHAETRDPVSQFSIITVVFALRDSLIQL